MAGYHREIAHQTQKNQTTGNAKINCRLEKTDKTGDYSQFKIDVIH